jgi:hypothetical protein
VWREEELEETVAFLNLTFEWRQHPRRPNWEQLWLVTSCSDWRQRWGFEKLCNGNLAVSLTEVRNKRSEAWCEKCGMFINVDTFHETPCNWTIEWKKVPGGSERIDNGEPWRRLVVRFSSRCHECGLELHNTVDCPRCGLRGGSRSEAIDEEIVKLLHAAAVARLIKREHSNKHEVVVVCPCCGDDIELFHDHNHEICCHRCHTKLKSTLIPNLTQVCAKLRC